MKKIFVRFMDEIIGACTTIVAIAVLFVLSTFNKEITIREVVTVTIATVIIITIVIALGKSVNKDE